MVVQLPPYEIALATCEGSRFLEEQLESLAAQTVPPSRLIVVDDASSDDSVTILHRWARRKGLPIVVQPGRIRQGCLASFAQALAATKADYVFLCDQDDLWDPDKAEILLRRMVRLEERHGDRSPLLVHSDLRLIDETGQVLHPSFHRLQQLNPRRDRLMDLALQNTVTGCAALVNRACLRAALPFPEEAVIHDWWLAMVVARLGTVDYDPVARVSYRQHGGNVVGASGFRQQMGRRLLELPLVWASGALVVPTLCQLQAFVGRYGPAELAPGLTRLTARTWPTRLRAALGLGLSKHGWLRTLGFYLCLALWRPQEEQG